MNARNRPVIASAFGFSVLLVSGAVLFRMNASTVAETRTSFGWATHTLEVENLLRETVSQISEAESGQRGFLLTGDEAYARTFEPAVDSITRLLASLRTLTADNQEQQRRLDTLGALISTRMSLLVATRQLALAHMRDSAMRIVQTGRGRLMMDSVVSTERRALAAESILLERRQKRVNSVLDRRYLIETLMLGIATLALLLAGTIWVWLRRSEQLVTICAWSKAIQHEGEWMSIESYMARRFGIMITHGISPAEAARLEAMMDAEPSASAP